MLNIKGDILWHSSVDSVDMSNENASQKLQGWNGRAATDIQFFLDKFG